MVRAVFFDIGETILDETRSWAAWADWLGVPHLATATIEPVLREMSLPVDVIASSERWGVEKPSPEFFDQVIEVAGVPAREIAYVGDRLDNDVLPAKKAGMVGVFLRRGPWGIVQASWPEAAQADLRIEGLAELATLLDRFVASRRSA